MGGGQRGERQGACLGLVRAGASVCLPLRAAARSGPAGLDSCGGHDDLLPHSTLLQRTSPVRELRLVSIHFLS